jgi:hypothetical protein
MIKIELKTKDSLELEKAVAKEIKQEHTHQDVLDILEGKEDENTKRDDTSGNTRDN